MPILFTNDYLNYDILLSWLQAYNRSIAITWVLYIIIKNEKFEFSNSANLQNDSGFVNSNLRAFFAIRVFRIIT